MSAQSRIASVAISVHSVVENVTQSHIILISVASTQPVANPRSFFPNQLSQKTDLLLNLLIMLVQAALA